MEEIKIIQYKANDGTIFKNKQDCLDYEEANRATYIMFTDHGMKTTDINKCYYVILKTRDDAARFLEDSMKHECTTTGLDKRCIGMFWWNDDTQFWMEFDEDFVNSTNIVWNEYQEWLDEDEAMREKLRHIQG